MVAPLLNSLADASAGLTGLLGRAPALQGFFHWAFFDTDAASHDARTADGTYMFLWWLSVFWFVLLMGLMGWFCFRWRRKPGVAAPVSPSHHTALEITWTIIPTLLLVVIFFKGFWDYAERVVARGDSVRMNLRAYKWNWEMTYASGRSITETMSVGGRMNEANIFYVPEGSGIQLKMTSSDVIHSFWVPDWRIKCDIFPNRYTSVWFETETLDPADPEVQIHPDKNPDSPGLAHEEEFRYKDHIVFCAEYCGDFHSEMIAVIRVVPREVYASWVTDPGIDWPGMNLADIGEILWKAKGCSSCHTTNGSAGTGPTWRNAWGTQVPLTDGTSVLYDENYVRNSIYTPAAQIHQGFANQMTVFTPSSVNERELGAIMAFMMRLAGQEMDPLAAQSIIDGGPASTTPPEGGAEPTPDAP
ncbi:MAG: cytochrome c oxidase subunit II transmembrane domain-containing protein [Phycisphaerales bacterium]